MRSRQITWPRISSRQIGLVPDAHLRHTASSRTSSVPHHLILIQFDCVDAVQMVMSFGVHLWINLILVKRACPQHGVLSVPPTHLARPLGPCSDYQLPFTCLNLLKFATSTLFYVHKTRSSSNISIVSYSANQAAAKLNSRPS